MKTTIPCLVILASLLGEASFAETPHEIAITIDDLPFVGTNGEDPGNLNRTRERFMRILNSLVENQVPATGFIIAGSIAKGQWELLEAFRKEGFGLGNHTYSHANLNRLSADKYIDEISHADHILQPIMTQPKYFRYPYLAEGTGDKKQEVQDYLASNQYVIAPVTIDSKDYQFNERLLRISWRVRKEHIEAMKKEYLAYMWKQTLKAEKTSKENAKQILLLHSNYLNSYCMDDIIRMYKEHGYRFISLNEAITNTAQPAQPIGEKPVSRSSQPQQNNENTAPAKNPTESTQNESQYWQTSQFKRQHYSNVGWLSDWEK
jgi:peptidoglycan/xylan/chitin deacetylase (PgdA/CDA1 family)